MTISASFKKRLKYFDLDISFSCATKSMMVMIGPSGGGKTTIIRMLAGLETPDEGKVIFGDEVWFDSARRINVTPQKRRLGYVFQDYNLFPHLNLFDNAAFAAVDKKEVDELFDLVQNRSFEETQAAHGFRRRTSALRDLPGAGPASPAAAAR